MPHTRPTPQALQDAATRKQGDKSWAWLWGVPVCVGLCVVVTPLCALLVFLTRCRLRRRGLVCFVGDDHPQPRGLRRL